MPCISVWNLGHLGPGWLDPKISLGQVDMGRILLRAPPGRADWARKFILAGPTPKNMFDIKEPPNKWLTTQIDNETPKV